jgi:hypothetical protein
MTDVKFPSIEFPRWLLALAIGFAVLRLLRVASVGAQGSPSGAAASTTMSALPGHSPAAAASPVSTGKISAATSVDSDAVTSYLSQVITWYRHLAVEESIARDPAEMLSISPIRASNRSARWSSSKPARPAAGRRGPRRAN